MEVTFLLPAPQAPIMRHYSVGAEQPLHVNVDDIPDLAEADMSAVIPSTNGVPIVVERAMYFTRPHQVSRPATGARA